jgi:hypothetical protein
MARERAQPSFSDVTVFSKRIRSLRFVFYYSAVERLVFAKKKPNVADAVLGVDSRRRCVLSPAVVAHMAHFADSECNGIPSKDLALCHPQLCVGSNDLLYDPTCRIEQCTPAELLDRDVRSRNVSPHMAVQEAPVEAEQFSSSCPAFYSNTVTTLLVLYFLFRLHWPTLLCKVVLEAALLLVTGTIGMSGKSGSGISIPD